MVPGARRGLRGTRRIFASPNDRRGPGAARWRLLTCPGRRPIRRVQVRRVGVATGGGRVLSRVRRGGNAYTRKRGRTCVRERGKMRTLRVLLCVTECACVRASCAHVCVCNCERACACMRVYAHVVRSRRPLITSYAYGFGPVASATRARTRIFYHFKKITLETLLVILCSSRCVCTCR